MVPGSRSATPRTARNTASRTAVMSCSAQPGRGRATVAGSRTTTRSTPSSSYPAALITVVPASTLMAATGSGPAVRGTGPAGGGVEDHGEQQYSASDHEPERRVEVEQGQPAGDRLDHHDAEQRGERRAATAEQAGAA